MKTPSRRAAEILSTVSDRDVSARTNQIMREAGNPMERCPTCCRAAAEPYRRERAGFVVEGCIAAFHAGHLVSLADQQWHGRPEGRQLRAETLAFLLK